MYYITNSHGLTAHSRPKNHINYIPREVAGSLRNGGV